MLLALLPPVGLAIGLVLGALGAGGSVLAVPALVYLFGQSFQEATTTSLVIVGLLALVGVTRHWRAGHVDLRRGVAFGGAGAVGAVAGTFINRALDGDVLKVAFALLMLAVAARMVLSSDDGDTAPHVEPASRLRLIAAATLVGTLTGVFGVGGGFVIVPTLVLALGFAMPMAIGTSLVVITINAVVSLGARADTLSQLDVPVVGALLVVGALGVWVGSAIADRVNGDRLTPAFVALLTAVALYTGVDGLLGSLST